MMRIAKIAAAAVALAMTAPVLASDPIVEAALVNGTIGEQWDGYLGFVSAPSNELKAAVDAIFAPRVDQESSSGLRTRSESPGPNASLP